jgi:hypothetical protein
MVIGAPTGCCFSSGAGKIPGNHWTLSGL